MKKLLLTMIVLFSVISNANALDAQTSTAELEIFDKECNSGKQAVCVIAGLAYEYGDGVKKDMAKANSYYAKVTDPFYYFHIGKKFYLPKNPKGGVYLRTSIPADKACDGGGEAEGCKDLGGMYLLGTGVKHDDFKAVELYKKSCDGGYASGCFNLGIMYEYGQGVKQDNFKAKEAYGKACDSRHDMGCKAYARLNKI